MMTDEELEQAKATINTLETEISGLTLIIQESIERARDFNARTRDTTGKRTSLQANLSRVKMLMAQEINARSIAARAAAAKVEQEAAAAKAAAAEADQK